MVTAAATMIPPMTLRRSGRASCHIAGAAAGRPNIITGKNPAMNVPVPSWPAK
jgi:hypothetical protein